MEEAATSVQLNVKQEEKKKKSQIGKAFFPCFDHLSVVYVLLKVWYWKWKEMQESMY